MPMFNSSTNPVELMRFGVDYKFKLRLRNFEITFRPLSSLETINIESDSRQHLLQMKEHQRTDIVYSLLFAQKTIQQASTSEPGKSDYQITELVLSKCTPDEVMYLFNEYNKCVDKVNPSVEKLSTEELNELVDKAKKNLLIMTELSFWQMENLCRALIDQTVQQDK